LVQKIGGKVNKGFNTPPRFFLLSNIGGIWRGGKILEASGLY